jgi:hypothetical protein
MKLAVGLSFAAIYRSDFKDQVYSAIFRNDKSFDGNQIWNAYYASGVTNSLGAVAKL